MATPEIQNCSKKWLVQVCGSGSVVDAQQKELCTPACAFEFWLHRNEKLCYPATRSVSALAILPWPTAEEQLGKLVGADAWPLVLSWRARVACHFAIQISPSLIHPW